MLALLATLDSYAGLWEFTTAYYDYAPPVGYSGFFVTGDAYDGYTYFYPMALAKLSGTAFSWDTNWFYQSYYGYSYDYGIKGEATLQ